ncbi:MAG TPA: phosphoribosylaminoimidazolesuccinocarboxamide synthase [Methanocorpusculum sp.]|nr:phosphoribosylaminoimidazolesuccinocarboxamide synthase [Methanocorpusculum sp.]
MKLVYSGKTKDVFALNDGNYLLKFKDDCTGANGVFDPGMNSVGLSIKGAGKSGLRLTKYFFDLLIQSGIPTHYISSNLDDVTMTVRPAKIFGHGIEVICRFRAVGSFIRRYGEYISESTPLPAFVEVTLKDDKREDPPITKDALDVLNILSTDNYEIIKKLTQKIATIIKEDLHKKDIELYDIKLEFGLIDNQIVLIDEISGGNMRAYRNGKHIMPLELESMILGNN